MKLRLRRLAGRYAVCRLGAGEPLPSWARGEFTSVTRTPDELSVICEEGALPPDVRGETGWRVFFVEGPLPFDAVGIAAALTSPLADAGISILLVGTYDTDYLLIRDAVLERAAAVLTRAGHLLE